jgi:hypothetical protein
VSPEAAKKLWPWVAAWEKIEAMALVVLVSCKVSQRPQLVEFVYEIRPLPRFGQVALPDGLTMQP